MNMAKDTAELESLLAKLPLGFRSVIFTKATEEENEELMLANKIAVELAIERFVKQGMPEDTKDDFRRVFAAIWLEGAMWSTGYFQIKELRRLRELLKVQGDAKPS
jgi:hypothetical protein